jgi:hypothetical protein
MLEAVLMPRKVSSHFQILDFFDFSHSIFLDPDSDPEGIPVPVPLTLKILILTGVGSGSSSSSTTRMKPQDCLF